MRLRNIMRPGTRCLIWAGLLGCVPAMAPAAATTQPAAVRVTIDNFTFEPAVLTIPVGATVVWTNRDDVPHTVTSEGKVRVLNSNALDTDDTFQFRFTKAGEYPYFCAVHPHMRGRVVVK